MPIPEDGGSAPESVMDSDHAIIQQRSSPISELHEDILWLIFLLNSDMGNSLEDVNFWAETETEISALDTTLISSRVCRRWRSLLLDWPVIWGRSLHLWRLCQLGKDGSKEVIRRTGAAPLCLVGYVDPSSEFNSQTFTPLVQANWWRIQIFCVCTIHDSDIPSPDWFQVFVQSAPLLEIFALKKTYDGKGMPLLASGHEAQLFNGFAPRLRFLCCTALALKISNVSQASWLGQLRLLKLSELEIDPIELVDVLRRTHLLESLYIRWFPLSLGQANAGALERHIINLPRLVNLRISHSFHVDLAFIRIIRPSIHCSLFSFLPDRLTSKAETISRDDMMVAFEALKPYIDGYLAFWKVQSVSIWAGDNIGFSFDAEHPRGVQSLITDKQSRPSPHFKVNLSPLTYSPDTLAGADPVSSMATLLRPHWAHLASIQDLRLTILGNDDPHMDFEPIIAALEGVESLTTNRRGLKVLHQYGTDNMETFFRQLQKLKLIRTRADGPLSGYTFKPILKNFLSRRHVGGVSPVRSLEFDCRPYGDWSFLDKLDGLRVSWPIDCNSDQLTTYVCGTGSRDTLNLNRRF